MVEVDRLVLDTVICVALSKSLLAWTVLDATDTGVCNAILTPLGSAHARSLEEEASLLSRETTPVLQPSSGVKMVGRTRLD
jgi:hypothetical protein